MEFQRNSGKKWDYSLLFDRMTLTVNNAVVGAMETTCVISTERLKRKTGSASSLKSAQIKLFDNFVHLLCDMGNQALHFDFRHIEPDDQVDQLESRVELGLLFGGGTDQAAQRLEGVHHTNVMLLAQVVHALGKQLVEILPGQRQTLRIQLPDLGLQDSDLGPEEEELRPELGLRVRRALVPLEKQVVHLENLLFEGGLLGSGFGGNDGDLYAPDIVPPSASGVGIVVGAAASTSFTIHTQNPL